YDARMRILLGLTLLMGLGCDDDTTMMSTQDLSAKADLSAPADNCLAVITCAAGCAGNATCQGNCAAKGTAAAQMKYQALGQCAVSGCIVAQDGGVIPCASATDTSQACQDCIAAYAQGPACMTQLNACLTDK